MGKKKRNAFATGALTAYFTAVSWAAIGYIDSFHTALVVGAVVVGINVALAATITPILALSKTIKRLRKKETNENKRILLDFFFSSNRKKIRRTIGVGSAAVIFPIFAIFQSDFRLVKAAGVRLGLLAAIGTGYTVDMAFNDGQFVRNFI